MECGGGGGKSGGQAALRTSSRIISIGKLDGLEPKSFNLKPF